MCLTQRDQRKGPPIEELVNQDHNSKPIIYKTFPQTESTKLDALVNFIQNSTSGAICKVRSGRKNVMVPKNSTIAVSCRANTGPVNQQTPVFFYSNQLAHLPEGLELYETLLYMKPGKTSRVQIAVYDGTDHDIVLNGSTALGVLQAVKSVTEADVRLSVCRSSCEHQHLEQHESQESTTLDIPGKQDKKGINPLTAADLSGLNHDHRKFS